MASGRLRWSGESGGWVEDTGKEGWTEPIDSEPEPIEAAPLFTRRSARVMLPFRMARWPQMAMVLLGAGIVAMVCFTAVLLVRYFGSPPSFEDLGPGASNVAGLKGHLVTRWNRRVQYKLRFEPLYAIYEPGFSYAVGHPPEPLWVNIRLLDDTGYALCGKQIDFGFNQADDGASGAGLRAAAVRNAGTRQQRASLMAASAPLLQQPGRRNDIFQEQAGDDNQVVSVSAQGVLPCSEDQYRKFSYWDFSTNFPSIDEQDALMKAPVLAAARAWAAERAAERRRQARIPAFFIEGDANVASFDSSSAVLQLGTGQSFALVKGSEAATADAWAASGAPVHYKCDTHANCTLTSGGGMVSARSVR